MTDEERKAIGWLSALDIKSEYEAISKEIVLNLINKQEKAIDRMAEVLNDFDYDEQCEKCRTDICNASEDRTEYMKCIKEYFMKEDK